MPSYNSERGRRNTLFDRMLQEKYAGLERDKATAQEQVGREEASYARMMDLAREMNSREDQKFQRELAMAKLYAESEAAGGEKGSKMRDPRAQEVLELQRPIAEGQARAAEASAQLQRDKLTELDEQHRRRTLTKAERLALDAQRALCALGVHRLGACTSRHSFSSYRPGRV